MFYSKIRKLFLTPGMTWLINCLLQPFKYATSWCFLCLQNQFVSVSIICEATRFAITNLSSILNKMALWFLVAHLIWPFIRSGKSIISPNITAVNIRCICSLIKLWFWTCICNVKECKDKPQWILTFKPNLIKSGQWLMDNSSRQTDGRKWTGRNISRPLTLWIQTRRCVLCFPYN